MRSRLGDNASQDGGRSRELTADIAIIGGGLGGVAAALAASRMGHTVVLTEDTDWLGGQLTSQAVPPDEHPWIEQFGCTASYRALRNNIRAHYRQWYPLTATARSAVNLNPGAAPVGALCHEPRVALAVLEAMLAPYRSGGNLRILLRHRPVAADLEEDTVRGVTLLDEDSGDRVHVTARYFLDATETGELLPMTGTEYVTGSEAQSETGEPHAPAEADPLNMQAVTVCFAMDHLQGEDHTIDRPASYQYWRDYRAAEWPEGPLSWKSVNWFTREPLTFGFQPNPEDDPSGVHVRFSTAELPVDADLWLYRRIAARKYFLDGAYRSDICLVNWLQNDYYVGPIFEVPAEEAAHHVDMARGMSLSLLYWLQTEAPRHDGGVGYPGLRLRGDLVGTADGLAKRPYIRESRRIRAVTTVVEQDLAQDVRGDRGLLRYPDTVGIGSYRLDFHVSTGKDQATEIPALPFYVPLGALIPIRVANLLAAAKNLGTTHITNATYRLHPIEWNIGESSGLLAGFCLDRETTPSQVQRDGRLLEEFQALLVRHGVELDWPKVVAY